MKERLFMDQLGQARAEGALLRREMGTVHRAASFLVFIYYTRRPVEVKPSGECESAPEKDAPLNPSAIKDLSET